MSKSLRDELVDITRRTRLLTADLLKKNPQARVRLDHPRQVEEKALGLVEMQPKKVEGGSHPTPPWASQLWDFKAQVQACQRCPLGKTRKNFVFGEGSKDADLMFVGEAPGREEDELGRPFVGKAGQLLDRIIHAMGLKREQVFIANLIKCRPPRNRDPLPEEIETCRPYVEHQIDLIKPRVIVALGRFAAQTLLQDSTGITRMRGNWMSHKGIPVMPTFHPAALLRDDRLKRPVWEDMKMVMKKIIRETS